jgi:hypothetical protein
MPIEFVSDKVVMMLRQRCLHLFAALLLLIVTVPFLEGTPGGRVLLNVVNLLILVAATAAVARSGLGLLIAILLAGSSVAFQGLAFLLEAPRYLLVSRAFAAGFYFITVGYLLAYVMRHEVLTPDRLYGAAAAFLMLGIIWAYFYSILLVIFPGALTAAGNAVSNQPVSELLYFSFTVLTSTGFGDIVPVHPVARMLCVLEQILGLLYIAILIARLAGTYPASEHRKTP